MVQEAEANHSIISVLLEHINKQSERLVVEERYTLRLPTCVLSVRHAELHWILPVNNPRPKLESKCHGFNHNPVWSIYSMNHLSQHKNPQKQQNMYFGNAGNAASSSN